MHLAAFDQSVRRYRRFPPHFSHSMLSTSSLPTRSPKMMASSRGIVLHDSRVIVARQQCHQRRGPFSRVRRHFSCVSITTRHPGFSPCPPGAIAIGWPESERSTRHIAKMLNEFERVKFNVIDSAVPSVRRNPCIAWPPAREFQYRCNRCLCPHPPIVAHLNAVTGVPWCQSTIISKTTSNSSHQRLKPAARASPQQTRRHVAALPRPSMHSRTTPRQGWRSRCAAGFRLTSGRAGRS
jgi:hypothetical protein